jgi:hypothetical protein
MAEEQAVKKEEKPAEGAAQGEAARKNKKINRMTSEEINKKIEALVQANQIKSKYYQHLTQRKNEQQVQ